MTMRSLERERVLWIAAWPVVLLTALTSSSSEGQERSVAQAVAGYYDTACRAEPVGDALGCYLLAEAYWVGKGVPQDRTRAVQLYRKACEGGRMRACTRLTQSLASSGEPILRGLPSAPTTQPLAAPAGQQQPAPASPGSLKPPSELWPKAVPASPAASQIEQKKPPSAQPPPSAPNISDLIPLEADERLLWRDPDEFVRVFRRYHDETVEFFNDFKRAEPEAVPAIEATLLVVKKDLEIAIYSADAAKQLKLARALAEEAQRRIEEEKRLKEKSK
jgi:Sel1 repeat